MKIRFNLESLLFSFVVYFHAIYILFSVIMPSYTNKLVLLFLIIMYLYYNKYIAMKKIWLFIGTNLVLVFYAFYTLCNYGLFAVAHSDYYSFVLFIYVFLTYSDQRVYERFIKFFYRRKKRYLYFTVVYFLFLLFTIVFQNGLHTGFGSTIPVLYGPYSVPHILAYGLLSVYCASALFYNVRREKTFLIIKCVCVICVIWTAARSAVLALAILIFVDYLSIRKTSKKAIVFFITLLLIVYTIFFTDILMNNPLIQKTLSAIEQGSVTNGRERFTEIILYFYSNSTTGIEKVFGIGMANLRSVMLTDSTVGAAIHAHNDYVNALSGYGFIGLIILVISQLKAMKLYEYWLCRFLAEALLFILCFYNGLAMYTVVTPCLIVVLALFRNTEMRMKHRGIQKERGTH